VPTRCMSSIPMHFRHFSLSLQQVMCLLCSAISCEALLVAESHLSLSRKRSLSHPIDFESEYPALHNRTYHDGFWFNFSYPEECVMDPEPLLRIKTVWVPKQIMGAPIFELKAVVYLIPSHSEKESSTIPLLL
jgi:hypothetical protein